MFLLNIHSFRLELFVDDSKIPPYYILSHTWGGDEVTYQDVRESSPRELAWRKGWQKIEGFCAMLLAAMKEGTDSESFLQAEDTGWDDAVSANSLQRAEYVWVDTCCINKESSAELSEAINSMYRWHAEAIACIAYFEDVNCSSMLGSEVSSSRWFTRGWTLQELLAPRAVLFYADNWRYLGERSEYAGVIATVTSIRSEYLNGQQSLWEASIAEKMSWAAHRTTTRSEDIAYCLMGIFDINMPLLYGEGGVKAYNRLQEEIIKDSTDESIFAWDATGSTELHGMLASHPRQFRNSSRIVPLSTRRNPMAIRNGGFMMKLGCLKPEGDHPQAWDVLLDCAPRGSSENVGIAVRVSKSHEKYPECWRVAARPAIVLADRFSGTEQDLLFAKRSPSTLRRYKLDHYTVSWFDWQLELLEAWPGPCWQWGIPDDGGQYSEQRRMIKLVDMRRTLDLAQRAFSGRGHHRIVIGAAFATRPWPPSPSRMGQDDFSEQRRDYFVLGILVNAASGLPDMNILRLPSDDSPQPENFRESAAWAYMCGQIKGWSTLTEPFASRRSGTATTRTGQSRITLRDNRTWLTPADRSLRIALSADASEILTFAAPEVPRSPAFRAVGLQALQTEDDCRYWESFFVMNPRTEE